MTDVCASSYWLLPQVDSFPGDYQLQEVNRACRPIDLLMPIVLSYFHHFPGSSPSGSPLDPVLGGLVCDILHRACCFAFINELPLDVPWPDLWQTLVSLLPSILALDEVVLCSSVGSSFLLSVRGACLSLSLSLSLSFLHYGVKGNDQLGNQSHRRLLPPRGEGLVVSGMHFNVFPLLGSLGDST